MATAPWVHWRLAVAGVVVEAAVCCMEARWVLAAWDLELAEAAEDPEEPLDPSHLRLTAPNDSAVLASNADWAKDCLTDFRSCLANATVWNLKINVR